MRRPTPHVSKWLVRGLILGCVGWLTAPPSAWGQTSSSRIGSTVSGGNRSAFGSGSSGSGMSSSSSGSGLLSQIGNSSQSIGSNRITRTSGSFIGSDSSDSSFVGANSTGSSGNRSMSSFGGMNGMSGLSGMSGLGTSGFGSNSRGGMFGSNSTNSRNSRTNNFSNSMNGRSNRQVATRTKLELGFRRPTVSTSKLESTLTKTLNSEKIARIGTLSVLMESGTATLSGRVATRADHDLAVRLAKLEPGVETVRDQLVVESSDDDALSPSDR